MLPRTQIRNFCKQWQVYLFIWYLSPKSTNQLFFFQLSQLWYYCKKNYHHRLKWKHSNNHSWRNKVKLNRKIIQLLFILSNFYVQWAVPRNISLFFYQWIFLFFHQLQKSKLISNLQYTFNHRIKIECYI